LNFDAGPGCRAPWDEATAGPIYLWPSGVHEALLRIYTDGVTRLSYRSLTAGL